MKWDSPATQMLAESLATAFGVPIDQIEAYVEARREKARQRFERHQRKWGAALAALTDVQAVLVSQAEADGHSINKLYTNRASRRTAVMMVKYPVWDNRKHRMGTKLLMVYPDGSRSTTMEKSISIKQSF